MSQPDERSAARRSYRMIRLASGDYLLPSNDAKTLWRLATYREDGSAETVGRKVTGKFWGIWKWDGGMPTIDQLAGAMEGDEWHRWEFWAGPFSTRSEAIEEALRVRA